MRNPNILFFKAETKRLIELMNPDVEFFRGKLIFKRRINNPYSVWFWLNQIQITFSNSLLEKHNELIKSIESEMVVLDSMCKLEKTDRSIILIPIGENTFEDTELGMQLRAALYVLILDLSLKIIDKYLKQLSDANTNQHY